MHKLFAAIVMLLTINAFAYTNIQRWQAACFIAKNEGLRLSVYTCVAGKKTIGWGSTNKALTSKGIITKHEADAELYKVLDRILAKIDADKRYTNLSFNQKIVLADMVYHYGSTAVFNAKDLNSAIASGNVAAVHKQLLRWDKAKVNGKLTVVKGLTNRCSRRAQLW